MTRATFVRLPALMLMAVITLTSVTQAQAPAAPAAPAQVPAAAPVPQVMTYEMAVQIIDAAEAEARTNKWNVTIVVTDAAGVIK